MVRGKSSLNNQEEFTEHDAVLIAMHHADEIIRLFHSNAAWKCSINGNARRITQKIGKAHVTIYVVEVEFFRPPYRLRPGSRWTAIYHIDPVTRNIVGWQNSQTDLSP